MQTWLIPSNPKVYDADASFKKTDLLIGDKIKISMKWEILYIFIVVKHIKNNV